MSNNEDMLNNWQLLQNKVIVNFCRTHPYTELPKKATPEAACYDVYLPSTQSALNPGEIRIVKLGFEVDLPKGYRLELYSRSGIASKGIIVVNSVGIIDSDFKGEVGIILMNLTNGLYPLNKGDRIGQVALEKVLDIAWNVVDEIDMSGVERNPAGFGSSGGFSEQCGTNTGI